MNQPKPLLVVRNLKTTFFGGNGAVRAVDGVDLHVDRSETLGLIGESGSGKSVTALSIMRLLPQPLARMVEGEVLYAGVNLAALSPRQMRRLRGKEISMIFQEPMTSLNPVHTCGQQVAESLVIHEGMGRREAMDKAVEMLRRVRIADPGRRAREYPHQLSGGMCQRVMIAMALACRPKLLIADEPTTALDVTVQAQILELLKELQAELGMAIILITHDMGVVAETARRVAVMYGARVVEQACVEDLFAQPLHPYTQALLLSIPRLGASARGGRVPLRAIAGSVPTLEGDIAPGCRFAGRCSRAMTVCHQQDPVLRELRPGHWVACWAQE
ncbi:MAG TPA: ABC transporter ATP-binding protein [Ramlibacter sp.]|uniref:ABC transporter ATP-binding protein n=1 Tax=Ramlibacter sp. TaxID=1917967 RepID=UPI002C73A04C|nr:ABC transporter ATP-binding protein [Ramlibacter sp.]HVZ44248.1 ABC transporter ATP-binding protein [Ramlibacter sp.]